MEDVKEELSPAMSKLAPTNYKGDFPFLTVADDVGSRDTIHEATSELSGDLVIEDVDKATDGSTCTRRLIFLYNSNVVQSEARYVSGLVLCRCSCHDVVAWCVWTPTG